MILLDAALAAFFHLQILEIDRSRLDPKSNDSIDHVGRVGFVLVVAQDQLQVVVDVALAFFGKSQPESCKKNVENIIKLGFKSRRLIKYTFIQWVNGFYVLNISQI